MYSNYFHVLPIGILCLVNHIMAQNVISVRVGDNGQFYTPNSIQAPSGSIINFQFVGTAHSVVQGSFSTPCQPLTGGFDSGISGLEVPGSSLSNPVQWNLTITDDSTPIWFYCRAQLPRPHCQNGMVGVINPPSSSNQTLPLYISASANSTNLSQPNTTSLQGVGASASALPFLPFSPTKPNTGAILGGIFGGLAGIIVLMGLLFLLLQSRKKARRLEAERLAIDGSSWLTRPTANGDGWRP